MLHEEDDPTSSLAQVLPGSFLAVQAHTALHRELLRTYVLVSSVPIRLPDSQPASLSLRTLSELPS